MKLHGSGLGIAALCLSIAGAAASACSSTSASSAPDGGLGDLGDSGGSSGSSSGGGSGSSSGGSGGACAPSAGTYKVTTTADGDAAGCSGTQSYTLTLPLDAGTTDAAAPTCTSSCTGTTLTSSCTSTVTVAGKTLTDKNSQVITYTSSGWSGTISDMSLGPDGGLTFSCSYVQTATKQ